MQEGQGKGYFDWFQVERHAVRSKHDDEYSIL